MDLPRVKGKNVFAINGTKYLRMNQIKFVEDSLKKIWGDVVCLSRPYPFKFLKDCLPQILLVLFLQTLSQIFVRTRQVSYFLTWKSRQTFAKKIWLKRYKTFSKLSIKVVRMTIRLYLTPEVLNCTLFSFIWIAFLPQILNRRAYSASPSHLAAGTSH